MRAEEKRLHTSSSMICWINLDKFSSTDRGGSAIEVSFLSPCRWEKTNEVAYNYCYCRVDCLVVTPLCLILFIFYPCQRLSIYSRSLSLDFSRFVNNQTCINSSLFFVLLPLSLSRSRCHVDKISSRDDFIEDNHSIWQYSSFSSAEQENEKRMFPLDDCLFMFLTLILPELIETLQKHRDSLR